MKKAMLSQPMAGKTDEEIIATREQAIKILEAKGYEIVNTLFTDEWYSKDMRYIRIPVEDCGKFFRSFRRSIQCLCR